MPLISTNDIELHRRLKAKAAELGISLGKLVDTYLQIGYQLKLENTDKVQKIKDVLKEEGA